MREINVEEISSIAEVIDLAKKEQKIALIKKYRALTGKGLKDSKDAIESCQNNTRYDLQRLVDLFHSNGLPQHNVTKEQFMKIIDKALDVGDTMYCDDMLDTVEQLCANLRKKGGLKYVQVQRDLFISKL
ncbi:MAG: ribosomal protein L7/L12 [Dehalococcoidia bacterium]|nr:MAG: ribosomal protein L7/L12 [Dehalococcoidia bacterium]